MFDPMTQLMEGIVIRIADYKDSHSTHIDPLQVTVGHSWRNNSIIGVDNGNNVHPQQFMKGAVQVTSLLLIMEIQIGDQNLQKRNKELNGSFFLPLV